MIWFSALVLIPLMAVVVTAIDGGWDIFWNTITNGQTLAAIRLTVFTAVGVTVVMTTPSLGQRPASASTSGTAVAASPTETAWIQQRGSAGRPGP